MSFLFFVIKVQYSIMYNDIASIYQHIFPINQVFLSCLQSLLPEPPASILDVGCGNGQYVDWFSRHGYYAVGIDSSAGMIEKARQDYQGDFLQLDFSRIDQLSDTFDCIFCIGNSLSYLPHESTTKFLRNVFKLLNSDGFFIIQSINWDNYRLNGSMEFPIQYLADGRSFHRSYESLPGSVVLFKTEIQRDAQTLQAWSDFLYPRYAESFQKEIAETGLEVTGVYGDFEQNPYKTSSSPALVITTHKS
ncbi:MAG: Methyltransferase type 12 [Anaerolinea thermophila]|uniref:Methyltransferase type 12 n=1 Tax=Anaerolinea thermophila TaxID=167964 RepID=A0A101FX81_9CHLR|nr:MAG: Methyltransferase type 12 [Anaerolinea thermophila]